MRIIDGQDVLKTLLSELKMSPAFDEWFVNADVHLGAVRTHSNRYSSRRIVATGIRYLQLAASL
jgi:hypothetical protein